MYFEPIPAARYKLAMGLFLALQAVMLVAAPIIFLGVRDSAFLGGWFAKCLLVVLGICSGQSSLTAIWLALGSGRALRQAPTVLLLWAAWMLIVLGVSLYPLNTLSFTLSAMAFSQLLLLVALLFAFRRVASWRVIHIGTRTELASLPQFSLQMFLLWIGGCAVLMGAVRLLYATNAVSDEFHFDLIIESCRMFAISMLTSALVVFPIMGIATARRIAMVPIVALVLVAGVIAYFESLNPFAGISQSYFLNVEDLVWLNGTHAIWLLANLLLLRRAGYRIERGSLQTEPTHS